MRVLSLFAILGHPVFYLIWHDIFPQKYESFEFRLFFFIPSLVWSFWDLYEPETSSIFQYATFILLTANLPFFFAYMYILNEGSSVWLGSLICGIFYLALLVDVLKLILMIMIGFSIAAITTIYNEVSFNSLEVLTSHAPVVAFAIFGGVVFKYLEAANIQDNKDNAIALAGSIAHELRTPIMGIQLELEFLSRENIQSCSPEEIEHTLSLLRQHHRKSSYIIDSLLQNVQRGDIEQSGFRKESAGDVVREVVEHYPFFPNQKQLLHVEIKENFYFLGDNLLMSQVIMNLIANALTSVAAAEKGDIKIVVDRQEKHDCVSTKDTGIGLKSKDRKLVFERFYSKTPGGAGLGLTFCQRVIHSFGGQIRIESAEGAYTEIKILLPKLPKQEKVG